MLGAGGRLFQKPYHLVSVIPPPLPTMGWRGYSFSSLHASPCGQPWAGGLALYHTRLQSWHTASRHSWAPVNSHKSAGKGPPQILNFFNLSVFPFLNSSILQVLNSLSLESNGNSHVIVIARRRAGRCAGGPTRRSCSRWCPWTPPGSQRLSSPVSPPLI